MVTIFTDPRMLEHTPPKGHPERPERLQAVQRHLARIGILHTAPSGVVRPATDAELELVHTPGHIRRIALAQTQGGGQIEADTWMSPGSELAARVAAGAVVEAVDLVLSGPGQIAACLVRPPGHHALADEPMGFCLYNSIAVGAAHAVKDRGLGRVLIVDFDVHHGNGTQAIFYDDPSVGFLSIHRHPFYPGSGLDDETGTADALGTKLNIPLPYGTSRSDFLDSFRSGLERLAARIRPELILISAGFDAHAEDPVGDLGLDTEDFEPITQAILDVAAIHAGGRVVSVMEGGYNVPILAGCVALHLETLGAEPLPPGSR